MGALLATRLETVVQVRSVHLHQGRERVECSLVEEDGETLHIYEGQLKEVGRGAPRLEEGRRYRLTFAPYVNNRWVEVKLVGVALA